MRSSATGKKGRTPVPPQSRSHAEGRGWRIHREGREQATNLHLPSALPRAGEHRAPAPMGPRGRPAATAPRSDAVTLGQARALEPYTATCAFCLLLHKECAQPETLSAWLPTVRVFSMGGQHDGVPIRGAPQQQRACLSLKPCDCNVAFAAFFLPISSHLFLCATFSPLQAQRTWPLSSMGRWVFRSRS